MYQELIKAGKFEEAKNFKEKLAAAQQSAPVRDKEKARLEQLEKKLDELLLQVEILRKELKAQSGKDK